MPAVALARLIPALSALLLSLTALYGPTTPTPITGIFGPTASSTVPNTTVHNVPDPFPTLQASLAKTPQRADALPEAPTPELGAALAKLQGALVNILCTSKDRSIHSISASGVIFDSRGLILTNSHVAQYYLLEHALPQGTISCVVRTGSPAQGAYQASLVYLSSQWLQANPNTLSSLAPRGTGEHDFAVLALTGTGNASILPLSFPFIQLSSQSMKKGQAVGIASYGAQELSVREITRALRPTLAFSTVTNRYSFAETTVDLVSIGGTIAAQEGSSGGGIVDERGTLAALITTSSQEGPFLTRDMRAVTPEHIRTSFHTETGRDFDANFSKQSIDSLIAESASTFTALGAKLLRALGR